MNARQAKMEQRPRNGTTGSSWLLTDLGKTLITTQLEVFVKNSSLKLSALIWLGRLLNHFPDSLLPNAVLQHGHAMVVAGIAVLQQDLWLWVWFPNLPPLTVQKDITLDKTPECGLKRPHCSTSESWSWSAINWTLQRFISYVTDHLMDKRHWQKKTSHGQLSLRSVPFSDMTMWLLHDCKRFLFYPPELYDQ